MKKGISWALRILCAVIMLQTLFFKFSASAESVYIFTKVGIEPWGRIMTGVFELIASVLILIPSTIAFGALLAAGIMAGAILMHFTILGLVIMNDGGQLFFYALLVLIASSYLLFVNKNQLPLHLLKK